MPSSPPSRTTKPTDKHSRMQNNGQQGGRGRGRGGRGGPRGGGGGRGRGRGGGGGGGGRSFGNGPNKVRPALSQPPSAALTLCLARSGPASRAARATPPRPAAPSSRRACSRTPGPICAEPPSTPGQGRHRPTRASSSLAASSPRPSSSPTGRPPAPLSSPPSQACALPISPIVQTTSIPTSVPSQISLPPVDRLSRALEPCNAARLAERTESCALRRP